MALERGAAALEAAIWGRARVRYLSVCSGIEAASAAWHPLGWGPVAFSEIEAFPCAVLAHHYPTVPNWGDITKFKEWPDADVDVLVGGTPCQSFSVAGLRGGLADPRGNLALTFLAIAERYRPRWVVWENVPGVLSADDGRALGAFLGGLAELGYGFAYRVLDAQYFGLAQRRKRVFVVGHLGDWQRAAAVLFERESLLGHPAPRRKAGERVAPTIEARANAGGAGWGTDFLAGGGMAVHGVAGSLTTNSGPKSHDAGNFSSNQGVDAGYIIPTAYGGNNGSGALEVATACRAKGGTGHGDFESETFVVQPTYVQDVADPITTNESKTWTHEGTTFRTRNVTAFDTTQITSPSNYSVPRPGDPCHPLAASAHVPTIAFSCKDSGADASQDLTPTLRAMNEIDGNANAGGQIAVAFSDTVGTLSPGAGGGSGHQYRQKGNETTVAGFGMHVRRLTPTECERLQGFPDGHTAITYRGKPAADGPRYKALGNSMAVPVISWIGRRIELVETMTEEKVHAA